jgi:cysteine-rich repeat protein
MPGNRQTRFPQCGRFLTLVFLLLASASGWAGAPAHDADGIENLRRAAAGSLAVSLDRSTGTVSFLRAEPGVIPIDSAARSSSRATTMAFLERFGSVFGLRQPAEELQLLRETTDPFGFSHVVYRQVYQGIPVFASDFRSHFGPAGELTRISATTVPDLKVDPDPRLHATEAQAIAVARVARHTRRGAPSTNLRASASELVIFRSGLLQGVSGRNYLAYQVEVTNDSRSVREFVFVDAHTGQVIDQISGIHEAIDRRMYNGGLGPQFRVWSEGDALPYVGADAIGINHLIDYTEDTYNLFITLSNGTYPSYDASEATMHGVLNDPAINCPNASWNGVSTNYCNGVSGDDTVAHEWTHAYTEYTHALIYQWQPGALNESYSDIFGEVVDMLNGAGTDAPIDQRSTDGTACSLYGAGVPATDNSYRWLSGEDDPSFGGAIRDLWFPECYGDPGKVGSSDYFCSADDGGGVHTNSGVPNHAFALAVDGGTYNGQTISALGLAKATHVYWRAMGVYQGPGADFADHADALEASCADLVGSNLPALSTDTSIPSPSGLFLTSADCDEINDAIAAVELRTEPAFCQFDPILEPDSPALCLGHGEQTMIAATDWEGGLGAWTVSTHGVAKPLTFDTGGWAVVGSLPSERPGNAAFVADLDQGDCLSDDESGALSLDSPVIAIPGGTLVPRVAIDHWLATEAGYDGGNLKISVNGGPFVLIPPSAIDFNPYNTTLVNAPDNTNPLAGEAAFSGTDEGGVSGSWGQSQISLFGLAQAGDEFRLRFDFGVDGCAGVTGWYVDDVRVYSCADELPPSDCGNGELGAGEQCDDGNTYIGDGCSNSCQVEEGWQCTAPTPAGVVLDPGFEAGTPSPAWSEASTNFGTPICNEAACGLGGGSGPADGSYWAWFGGVPDNVYEEGSLTQSVSIPETATELRFELEITACDTAADYLEVLIDNNPVFVVNGSSPLCGVFGYTPRMVDITAYANGGSHSLEFHGETFSNNLDASSFFVDNVSIPGTVSECTALAPSLTLIKEVTNDSGGTAVPANWTLHAGGPTPFSGAGPSVNSGSGFAAGTYALSESGGPAGYSASAWVCVGASQESADTITLTESSVATCTITNDDAIIEELLFQDGFESDP